MRHSAWMIAGAFAVTTAAMAAGADGSGAASGQSSWARWQGRLSLGTTSAPWRPGANNPAPTLGSASLMGDYYFSRWPASPHGLGGFRATSGLIFGSRSMLGSGQPGLANGSTLGIGTRAIGRSTAPYASDQTSENATLPYLGLGYTSLSLRNGWGFSADLGLVGQSAGGAARLGRSLYNGQSLDDAVREMRMTPLLQLGVWYSF